MKDVYGFMKSWSSSGSYGSDCFDSTGNGYGCVSQSGPGQIGHGPEGHGWLVFEVPKFRQQQSIVTGVPLLKNFKTHHSHNSSNINININGLGKFEFALFSFFFFFMIEKFGFVLEYIYACLILFWMRNMRWERRKGRKKKKRTNWRTEKEERKVENKEKRERERGSKVVVGGSFSVCLIMKMSLETEFWKLKTPKMCF